MNKICNPFSILKGPIKKIGRHPISFFLIILGATQAVLTFYPGSVSVDSWNQFHQAVSHKYEDWHPPIMAWVWHYLLWIKKGPQPMLLLHIGMFWAGLFLMWYRLIQKGKWTYVLIPFIGVFPTVFVMIGVIWKDVGLGASLLLVFSLLMLESSHQKKILPIFFVVLVYAMAIRRNAIGATLPIFLVMPYFLKIRQLDFSRHKKYLILISLLSVVFTILTIQVLERYVIAAKKSYIFQSIMIHDLAYIETKTNQELVPKPFRTSNYSKASVKNALKDLRADDPLYFYGNAPYKLIFFDELLINQLKVIWMTNVLNYFNLYVQTRFQIFKSLFGIGFGQCRINHFFMSKELGGGLAWLNPWRNYWSVKSTKWAANTPMFSGWFYLVLSLVGLGLTLVIKKGEFLLLARTAFFSSVLYSSTYLPSTVSCDFRYLWPLPILTIIGWILILTDFNLSIVIGKFRKIVQS